MKLLTSIFFYGLLCQYMLGCNVVSVTMIDDAGWSSPVARWAHNPKVASSNLAPATILEIRLFGLAQAALVMIIGFNFFAVNSLLG